MIKLYSVLFCNDEVFNIKTVVINAAILALCCFSSVLNAEVKGTNGNIFFDSNFDQVSEMTLNSVGLGIGKLPSQALDVAGNATITSQLMVGGNTGSANLNIHGTMGYTPVTYSSSANVGSQSMILANPAGGGSNIELVLPYAGNVNGQVVIFKQISTGNTVLLNGGGASFDGAPYIKTSASNLSALSLISSANNWNILSTYGGVDALSLASMSNIVLWYDGDDIDGDGVAEGVGENVANYQSSTGNVLQWNDKSSSAYHLTALSGNTTLLVSVVNGRAAVYFDSDSMGNISTSPNLGRGDTFGVFYRPNTANGDESQYFWNFNPDAKPGLFTKRNASSGNTYGATGGTDFSSGNVEVNGESTINLTLNSWHLCYAYAREDWGTRTGGIIVGTNNGNTKALVRCYIAEIIFFNRQLSIRERRQVEAYLKKKWGLNNIID